MNVYANPFKPNRTLTTTMAVGIVIVGKGGEVKESKTSDAEPATLSKKCNPRSSASFAKRASWPAAGEKDVTIELWARTEGRAGTENKYDFPPPADKAIFFGACCLVAKARSTGTPSDLLAETWAKTYEKLFGGFEDLEDEEASADELENVPDEDKTDTGYLKDGFVTDGDGESDGAESSAEESSAASDSPSSESEDDLSLDSDESDGEGAELEAEQYDYQN